MFRKELLPRVPVKLLRDSEAEVRIAAAGKVTKFCTIVNDKEAFATIYPCIQVSAHPLCRPHPQPSLWRLAATKVWLDALCTSCFLRTFLTVPVPVPVLAPCALCLPVRRLLLSLLQELHTDASQHVRASPGFSYHGARAHPWKGKLKLLSAEITLSALLCSSSLCRTTSRRSLFECSSLWITGGQTRSRQEGFSERICAGLWLWTWCHCVWLLTQ